MLLIEINCKPSSDEEFSFAGKVVSPAMHSGIKLTKNKMEYNLKVIQSLQNGHILLKQLTKKVINQKAGFLGNDLGRDFRNLLRRTASDKKLHDKLFNVANIIHINIDLFQWFINCLIKNLLVVVLNVKCCQTNNYLKNFIKQLLKKEK